MNETERKKKKKCLLLSVEQASHSKGNMIVSMNEIIQRRLNGPTTLRYKLAWSDSDRGKCVPMSKIRIEKEGKG